MDIVEKLPRVCGDVIETAKYIACPYIILKSSKQWIIFIKYWFPAPR